MIEINNRDNEKGWYASQCSGWNDVTGTCNRMQFLYHKCHLHKSVKLFKHFPDYGYEHLYTKIYKSLCL